MQEARRVREQFEKKNAAKVETVTLVGGGANLIGIDEYVSERLELPVRVPDALNHFKHPPGIEPALRSLHKELAVASGLALRFFRA